MRKLRQPWTNKDIETLRALAKRRKAADIAAELGRSPGSIAVKAHQIGVSLRFHPKDGGLSGALDQAFVYSTTTGVSVSLRAGP